MIEKMLQININEKSALSKLAEHLSIHNISDAEFRYILYVHNISEFQNAPEWIKYTLNIQPDKNKILLDMLILIYTKHQDSFPKIMGEIVLKVFKKFLEKLAKPQHIQGFERTWRIVENTFQRDLEILGYEMKINFHGKTLDLLDVNIMEREIDKVRREERGKLYNILEKEFPQEYIALNGAYESYSNGGTNAYRQAISSCRNAYENFFKKLTESSNWKDGVNSHIESETLKKFIKNTYSYLSGFGDHSPKEREKEDAFLAIRITEDIMIRVLMDRDL